MTAAEQAAYNRGFANGSGDEGAYQRKIARLKADRKHTSDMLENVARWLDNGCDPAMAARELRLIATAPSET